MVRTMNKDAIVFPMANPTPEIMPELALAGGARVVGTGRSDYPNQINNVLVFPGLFRGALDVRAKEITTNWGHTRPNGGNPKSAVEEQGISPSSVAENISAGRWSASEVVNAWMASDGHRANILNPNYTKMGLGSVKVDNDPNRYGIYWAQLFSN